MIFALRHFVLVTFSTLALNAQSDPIQSLQKLYERADFKRCNALGKNLVTKSENKAKLPLIYKYLGICQFMLKNKTSAELSFKKGLQLNPKLTISSDEVLDTSVIKFFNQFKQSTASRTTPNNQPRRSASKISKTTLLIKSNVRANISINGILAGDTNLTMDADPGVSVIEVSAPGYRTRKFKVNIIKSKQNIFTVNLEKPKPKPTPEPQAPAIATAGKPTNRPTNKKEIDLFADEERQLSNRNLADEFARDQAAGGYTYQTPSYPQQPTYPAVVQQQPMPQQVYPQPGPVYVPQQPVYAPPAPVYQEPQQPIVQQAPPPNYEEPINYSRKQYRKKTDTNIEGMDPFVKLLPFGVPQFWRQDYLMATIISGVQIGGIYYWFHNDSAVDDFEAQVKAEFAEIDKNPNLNAQQKYDAKVARAKVVNPIIDDYANKSSMGLIAFFVGWGAGAVEAFMHTPKQSVSSIHQYTDVELAWLNQIKPQYDFGYSLQPEPKSQDPSVIFSLKMDF